MRNIQCYNKGVWFTHDEIFSNNVTTAIIVLTKTTCSHFLTVSEFVADLSYKRANCAYVNEDLQ